MWQPNNFFWFALIKKSLSVWAMNDVREVSNSLCWLVLKVCLAMVLYCQQPFLTITFHMFFRLTVILALASEAFYFHSHDLHAVTCLEEEDCSETFLKLRWFTAITANAILPFWGYTEASYRQPLLTIYVFDTITLSAAITKITLF